MKTTSYLLIIFGLLVTVFGGLAGLENGSLSLVLSGGIMTFAGISLLFYLK